MRDELTTAAELEAMTPAERDADFDSRIVSDLSRVAEGYLQRVRERLAGREAHRPL